MHVNASPTHSTHFTALNSLQEFLCQSRTSNCQVPRGPRGPICSPVRSVNCSRHPLPHPSGCAVQATAGTPAGRASFADGTWTWTKMDQTGPRVNLLAIWVAMTKEWGNPTWEKGQNIDPLWTSESMPRTAIPLCITVTHLISTHASVMTCALLTTETQSYEKAALKRGAASTSAGSAIQALGVQVGPRSCASGSFRGSQALAHNPRVTIFCFQGAPQTKKQVHPV